jgi:hypothetical protein
MAFLSKSGIKAEWPEERGFRFSRMGGFSSFTGGRLKPMDLGFWDERKGTLWLVELAGREIWMPRTSEDNPLGVAYAEPGSPMPAPRMTHTLLMRALDTLVILGCIWSGVGSCADLVHEVPVPVRMYPGENHIRMMFVFDTPQDRLELLSPIKDELITLLAGRTRLLGIDRISVLDVRSAGGVSKRLTDGLRIETETDFS